MRSTLGKAGEVGFRVQVGSSLWARKAFRRLGREHVIRRQDLDLHPLVHFLAWLAQLPALVHTFRAGRGEIDFSGGPGAPSGADPRVLDRGRPVGGDGAVKVQIDRAGLPESRLHRPQLHIGDLWCGTWPWGNGLRFGRLSSHRHQGQREDRTCYR